MNITKELLQAQLGQAIERRDELAGKLNAQIGAINQLHNLILLLDLPEAVPTDPKPLPSGGAKAGNGG